MAKDKFGLRELQPDSRDFKLGALYFLPELEELPEEFELKQSFPVKHQGNTDFCSAYASCGVSELQEGVELYPEYSFASSKAISGDVDEWGQDLRSAMKAHQKYGALPLKDAPEALKTLSNERKRDFNEYTNLIKKALPHRKKSYFSTKGQYDAYDNIRASIWKFREKKRAVEIGVIFGWQLGQYKLDTIKPNGFGHAMYVIGWNKEGLIAINSYGKEAGKDGRHIITREVINEYVPRFGGYMMIDIDPTMAKDLMWRKLWTTSTLCGKIKLLISKWWQVIWE